MILGGIVISSATPDISKSCFLAASSKKPSRGFTLVELLVVIAIIGILVALLLPAVQAARESARRVQCSNQLKQIAYAASNHETSQGFLPSSGWGWKWVGDPDRGFDRNQPGGWVYNSLPYMEQQALHDLGTGLTGTPKVAAANKLVQSILPSMICPSRREAKLYPDWAGGAHGFNYNRQATGAARSDYAINSGTVVSTNQGPSSAIGPTDAWWPDTVTSTSSYYCTGVSYLGSLVTFAHIRDGASNTYLVGEKYLNTLSYEDGSDAADNTNLYQGYDWDVNRWGNKTNALPAQDRPGYAAINSFGSAHYGGFNMAFCDGSVRVIAYEIAGDVHEAYANRKDGTAISAAY